MDAEFSLRYAKVRPGIPKNLLVDLYLTEI